MSEQAHELDDEVEYHAWRIGRPTRSAEVRGGDGTTSIEEGTLTAELVHREDLHTTREKNGWTSFYVGPDGGVGFGIGDGNGGSVAVPYDLVGIIELPEPMTETEADEWLTDDRLLEFCDDEIESDVRADDLLEEIR